RRRPVARLPLDGVAIADDGQIPTGRQNGRQPRGAVGSVVNRRQREGRTGRERDRIRVGGGVGVADRLDQLRDVRGGVGGGPRPVFEPFHGQPWGSSVAASGPAFGTQSPQGRPYGEPHGPSPFASRSAIE